MLVLTYTDESGTDVVVPLETGTVVTIGRNPGSTIRVRNPSVSRNHARIIEADGGWAVEDLGSSNRSFVNDEQVDKGPISTGDHLRFGKCAVVVGETVTAAAPSAKSPPGKATKQTPPKDPEEVESERKQALADEREQRRLAREARRAKKDASSDGESAASPKPAKRKRPTRTPDPEPEAPEPEPEAPEPEPPEPEPEPAAKRKEAHTNTAEQPRR